MGSVWGSGDKAMIVCVCVYVCVCVSVCPLSFTVTAAAPSFKQRRPDPAACNIKSF